MDRLETENRELKARALKEKEEREKYQELVQKRESEINELKAALKVAKGEFHQRDDAINIYQKDHKQSARENKVLTD